MSRTHVSHSNYYNAERESHVKPAGYELGTDGAVAIAGAKAVGIPMERIEICRVQVHGLQ